MHTSSWQFPTPDQVQVSQNRLLVFCDANPLKCAVDLARSRSASFGGGSGSGSLVDPKTSSSANNISVVLAGDNNAVTLSTSQDAKDNNMTSDSNVDAVVDYEQVLNYEDNSEKK